MKTEDAITAGIDMHNKMTLSNQLEPHPQLQMRIGIHAGLPIGTETDLYGTVVRLAAEIVEKAPAEQILISEAVMDFCRETNFNFIDRGVYEMPRTDEAVKIFEVLWCQKSAVSSAMLEASTTELPDAYPNP